LAYHPADNGLAGKRLPPAFALPVAHDQIRITPFARGAEFQGLSRDLAVKDHRGIAQAAKRHRHGRPGNHVIDDFMPGQDR
jgi:hypothetical protein